MARKGPGKAHREGLTVIELFRIFPDDTAAERWFEEQRWPQGRFCPDCGSTNTVAVKNRKPMPYRCRDCRGHFSVRKGTVMQSSKIGLQKWVVAIYMMTTGLKGTSSMKLYREVGIRQATAWFLMQRIREGFDQGAGMPFPGPVEADETYIGGKRKNMSNAKRKELAGTGRGGWARRRLSVPRIAPATRSRPGRSPRPAHRTPQASSPSTPRSARRSIRTRRGRTTRSSRGSTMKPSTMATTNTCAGRRTSTGWRASGVS